MVQSWENFMRPDGGAFEKDSILYGPAGIALAFGIDLLAQPGLNILQKRENSLMRRKYSSIASNKTFDNIRYSADQEGANKFGKRIAQKYKSSKNSISNKYTGLKGLARGISWGMLAITAADMVEGMMTPGVDRMALQKDEQAVYGSGGTFLDSSQAYTQRKRALLAIHESQLGIRGILSQEASGFHK